MSGQTVVEKITQDHRAPDANGADRPVRAGDFVSVRPSHVMTHDNTAPVMAKFRNIGATKVYDPQQPVFALDHDIQNESEKNLEKYARIEAFARDHGVDFHPAGEGIGHQVMVERGYVEPGSFVVASDSHSNMYGALGAVGTPVVRTDAAAIWATGEFWWQVPRTVAVRLEGGLRPGVTGKDVILLLCGLYSGGEVLNAAIEFEGPGVECLDLDERLTIANMTTEWGALVGWFPADGAPRPDADASYAGRITLDLGQVTPHVSGPDTVQTTTPLAEMQERRMPVHKAYLLSCVNSRFTDLVAAAEVLRDRKVADGVELYVAAASRRVQERAESEGVWDALVEAGARTLPPGCGPCIGLGTGLLEPGEVGISATNRNFKGRMGSRDAQCFLASPAVVAASAAAGYICGPGDAAPVEPEYRFEPCARPTREPTTVEILEGFPAQVRGRLVFLPTDNVNTDGIYGKDYTYRDDMTPADMARVVMENYDPLFAELVGPGDILVGGFNFGTGSSREQAVTALQAKGLPLVVAGSFSQTYLRNAFNNGFVCLECPELLAYLRQLFVDEISAGHRTILSGEHLEVDFARGRIDLGPETFSFPPLGEVPQSLVAAGGVENLVRKKLGLSAERPLVVRS